MKKTLITSAVLAIVVGAVGVAAIGPVMAHKGKGKMFGMEQRLNFETMDTNGDGKITREEIAAHRAAEFAANDTDNDGLLSPEELSVAILAKMSRNMDGFAAKMIERHDSDGDGMISADEMAEQKHRRADMFDKFDEDGDGAISVEEMEAMKERFSKRGKGWGHKKHSDQDDN